MKNLIISAPFGNYFQHRDTTSTLGTYTMLDRAGRCRWRLAWAVASRLWYSPSIKGWINKLGLPNPGIVHLRRKINAGFDVSDKIVSIHGFSAYEWEALLQTIADIKPLAVELNISCPNVGKLDIPRSLFKDAVSTGVATIVKLPPVRYERIIDKSLAAGISRFHCCNTYPTPRGGMSGPPLKPMVMACIEYLIGATIKNLDIIAGGGIRSPSDIRDYKEIGATRFAIATLLFNPKFWIKYNKNIAALNAACAEVVK